MFRLFLYYANFWAIPLVLVIRIIRPWIYIRFGTFWSDRIGHYVDESSVQWAEFPIKPPNQLELYWLSRKTCNEQWTKMIKRNFKVAWWVRYLDYWNKTIPGGKEHSRPGSKTDGRDIYGIIQKTKRVMEFLPEENQQARNWLLRQGWKEGEPFVCLNIRDSSYLENSPLHSKHKGSWDYHSHRNSDIETYVSAMEWLADQGVWVFRMGKIMRKPIPIQHKRIVDYAFHPERSDFLDIWLFAHCDLCISTGSGPDAISGTYQRPLLLLNFIPLFSNFWSWGSSTHFPKILIWEKSGKYLCHNDYMKNYYYKSELYKKAGIKILDLTSEQILEATKEGWQRVQGNWIDQTEDLENHKKFINLLKSWSDFPQYHHWINPNSRVGATWFRRHGKNFFSLYQN